jgi:DcmR-like sensory protein
MERKGGDMNASPEQSIHLGGFNLDSHRHVCAFFHTQDQEDKVIVPYLKEGINQGEKAFCALDRESRAHLLQELGREGNEVASAQRRRQLELRGLEEMYIRDGRFNQDAMLAHIRELSNQGKEQGFARTRFLCGMEWAIKHRVEIERLLEYEARLNGVLEEIRDPVVCVYDLAQFSAGVVLDILRTHPVVIIGEVAAENPFFVPPAVFLRELSERGAYSGEAAL